MHLPPPQHFPLSTGKGVSLFFPLLSASSPSPLTTTSNLSPGDHRRLSLSLTYAPAAATEKANPGATRNREGAPRDPRPLEGSQGIPQSPEQPQGLMSGSETTRKPCRRPLFTL